MITKTIDDRSVSAVPEEPDDLVALRRVIRAGDRVVGSTTRSIKRERENARPDRGVRVRIRMAVEAQSVSLDGSFDRLKVRGIIAESDNESVPHGSHHSMQVKPGDAITITKKSPWKAVEKKILAKSSGGTGTVLAAVDTSECGVARIMGTRLKLLPNIYSGASGKRYKGQDAGQGKFFAEIRTALGSLLQKGDSVMVFGPGQTKNRLANSLQDAGTPCRVVEGVDVAGQDGLHVFTKSEAMREAMSDSKLARASVIIDRVMQLAGAQSARFAMGPGEIRAANAAGAVESIVFSDAILDGEGEDGIVEMINDAEARGAEAITVDATTDIGLRVDGLGGAVALLRFAAGR